MELLKGIVKNYQWGSKTALAEFRGCAASCSPEAELWFGAMPGNSAYLGDGRPLSELIANNPGQTLGEFVRGRFGDRLPFLAKFLAPERPLSMQVHPGLAQARSGFQPQLAQSKVGQPSLYCDPYAKPELLYALEPFELLVGFRASRKAQEVLQSLPGQLARQLGDFCSNPGGQKGMRLAFASLLGQDPPPAHLVEELVRGCQERLESGNSPSVRADRNVGLLAKSNPTDPATALSLLLNPVTLQPGEVVFIPPGSIHVYLSGLGLEVMGASDNVLRLGLTEKPVAPAMAIELLDFTAAPPSRIAPEQRGDRQQVWYVPVDNFAVSVIELTPSFYRIEGSGPRLLLGLEGQAVVRAGESFLELPRAQAIFVSASEGYVEVRGRGVVAQVEVP